MTIKNDATEIAARLSTITEFNAELLRQYSILLEIEDMGETPRAQIETIYEVARKAHITLAGEGGLAKISQRVEQLLPRIDRMEPYEFRHDLCVKLMTAVMETTAYQFPWNVYLGTAAYAKLWLEYLDRKQQEGQE